MDLVCKLNRYVDEFLFKFDLDFVCKLYRNIDKFEFYWVLACTLQICLDEFEFDLDLVCKFNRYVKIIWIWIWFEFGLQIVNCKDM